MLNLLPAVILDALTVFIALECFRGNKRLEWMSKPRFALPWLAFSTLMVVLCTLSWSKIRPGGTASAGSMLAVVAMVLVLVVLAAPNCLLMAAMWSRIMESLMGMDFEKKIVLEKSCDQAEAAERQNRIKEAEEIFLNIISEKTNSSEKKKPLYANVHLNYGNFLYRQKRFDDAARQWREALADNLSPDKYYMTALRTADLLSQQLDEKADAAEILKSALAKKPSADERKALESRLKLLSDESYSIGE